LDSVDVTLEDYTDEIAHVRIDPLPSSGFKCVFAVSTCTLHEPGDKPGELGKQLGCFRPVELTIEWSRSAPWGEQVWKLSLKIKGHSIKTAIREDAALMTALSQGTSVLDFCAGPFRNLTDEEWSDALEACCVTGPDSAASQQAPKALIVMAPSAGGKTTVVTKLADSYGIDIKRSVRADGAIFRDFHKQYALVCENGVANDGLWFNAWPAAKKIVQTAKKSVLKKAMEKKQDLVISDTGSEVEGLQKLKSLLKEGGYLVCLVGIYADPQAILKRGIAREIGEGKRYNRSIEKLKATFEHFEPAISLIDGPYKIVMNAQGQPPSVKLEGNGYNGRPVPPTVAKALAALGANL